MSDTERALPSNSEPPRGHRLAYPLLALTLLGLYLPTLAPGATFTDGPEITVAITRLGVIHPTGYPIFTVVAHVFARLLPLPIPQIVKIELFNALCGITSALLVARMTRLLLLRFEAPPGHPRRVDLASVVAGLFVGVSPLLWNQVRIPEVYPFQMLLVCLAGYAWVRFEVTGKHGYVVAAALPMGMGLAHHVTMVYMLPAAFIYLLCRQPFFFVSWLVAPVVWLIRWVRPQTLQQVSFRGWWAFPTACLAGFLPLLSYYYLIWANAHTTALPWGDVHDWETLYNHATGRQYHGFMKVKELSSYWQRIKKLPVVFDQQFLPVGTILFFTGIVVTLRRRWRIGVFLLAYLVFNVGHGVYYSVGDYGNYFLPAVLSSTVLIGAGLWWVLGWTRAVEPDSRWPTAAMILGIALGGYGLTVLFYAKRTRRLAAELADLAPWTVTLPLGLLALAALSAAAVMWLRGRRPRWPLGPQAVSHLLLGVVLASLVPAVALRGRDLARKVVVGESYGEEVASHIPAGSVFMTQGDGFLFTMWYEHHVHERGTDFVTLDMGNLKTPWYQGYLRTRYPYTCDPLLPVFQEQPERYADQCGSYRQRVDLGQKRSWSSLGLRRGARRRKPVEVEHPVLRGADPQCEDEAWRKEHIGKECRCWTYGKQPGVVEEDCVHSVEEGGIVSREAVEVLAHRIIEDVIDERPVYERNMYTRWVKGVEHNPRGWSGPAYQRPPGQYDLINRGRFNQIVYHDDVEGLADPCGLPQAQRIELRPLKRVRTTRRPRYREIAAPNPRATLLKASYLTPLPRGSDDDASRSFTPGQAVYMMLHWFEGMHWDGDKKDRRGEKLREGVKVCFFDPEGQRRSVQSQVSGEGGPAIVLRTEPSWPTGRYLVQACSTGDAGERKVPQVAQLPCQRIILEYEFELTR